MAQSPPASGLLTSWKEIANFLGKGVRTVQRWEATLGLPVIRPADGRSGIVLARTEDLEAWVLKGQRGSRRDTDGWEQRNETVRATFSECVRELHRYHAEIESSCDDVRTIRGTLEREIERLKFLFSQWDDIRTRTLSENGDSLESKLH